MKCLNCDTNQFIVQKVCFSPEIKGKILEVTVPCMVCKNCQTPLMNTEQMTVLRRAATDKYEANHNPKPSF